MMFILVKWTRFMAKDPAAVLSDPLVVECLELLLSYIIVLIDFLVLSYLPKESPVCEYKEISGWLVCRTAM